MALYNDTYEIDLKINNSQLDIEPRNFSFTIEDSILQLYSTLSFDYNDFTGGFQEFLAFAEGIDIELTFGYKTDTIQNKFVVVSDELVRLQNPNSINGVVHVDLIHKYYKEQAISSGAYNKKISAIIQELGNKYTFNSINVDETGNQNKWYQMLLKDDEFMETILLPNAYAQTSQQSPYFLFIDAGNNLNLKNFYNMMNSTPIVTLEFNQEKTTELQQSTVIEIDRFRQSSLLFDKLKNRKIFTDDITDGTVNEETDSITDYPTMSGKYLPSLSNTNEKSYMILGDSSTEQGKKDNLKGLKINSTRQSLFLDNLIVKTYLDTRLKAGTTININIPNAISGDNSDSSGYFSDKYLIGKSSHTWDSANGFTTLHLIRKSVTLSSEYLLKSKLFTG